MNPQMNNIYNLPPPDFSYRPFVPVYAPRPRGFFFPMQGSLPHFAANALQSPADQSVNNYQFPNHSSGKRNGFRQHTVNQKSNWNKNPGAFYCDTCDRGYKNSDQLADHFSQHVKCHMEGCSFEAHSKIVATHIKMQHATGLAKKINNLDTPEDIRKWREQRRKNYPSLHTENGRPTQTTSNTVPKRMNPHRWRRGGFSNQPRMWPPTQMPNEWPIFSDQMIGEKENDAKRPRFDKHESTITNDIWKQNYIADPMAYLLNEDNDNDAAPDEVPIAKYTTNPVEDNATGGLALLMNSYTSDQDEEESKPAPVPSVDVSTVKKSPKQERNRRRPNRVQQFPVNCRQLTLLEKLLAPEIKRERNLILQCISYTVNNNFFDN